MTLPADALPVRRALRPFLDPPSVRSIGILAVASATAEGIRRVAETIRLDGGYEAVQLRVAEQYVHQFGQLAQKSTTLVVPASVSDVAGMISMAMQVLNKRPAASPPQPPPIHR